MVSFRDSCTTYYALFSVFMLLLTVTFAGDIVHPDSIAPKKPGCDNNFVLVQFYKYLRQKIN
jgi:signal peptide peptidase-like protein 2B